MAYKPGSNKHGLNPTRLGGRSGPVSTFIVYVMCLVMILAAPIGLASSFTTHELTDSELLFTRLITGALLLTMTPFGVLIARSVARARAEQRRLDRIGVRGIAEIIRSTPVDLEGEWGLGLTLRVSGNGFEPFEAEVECRDDDGYVVGARLPAVVDPVERHFTIKR